MRPIRHHRSKKPAHHGRLTYTVCVRYACIASFPMIQSYTPETDALTVSWMKSIVLSEAYGRKIVRMYVRI
ncbi:hypothetical protein [Peribacillus sp. NPDC056705]|uniref:hypothetical protein n=1 Tax=Peribacillus sp. NPDC056705 TaxID=3345918 RepID=UPI00374831BC